MINNDLISDVVFNVLKERRAKRQKEIEDYNLSLSLDENLKTLNCKINRLNRLIGSAKINNSEYENLELEKENLIKEKGDYLKNNYKFKEPNFYCKKCKDTGYYNNKTCSCFKELYKQTLFDKLNITQNFNFDFSMDTLSEKTSLKMIYRQQKEQTLNNFKSSLFLGKCGTGKTFLATCIANKFNAQGEVVFLKAFELNNVFIKYHCAPIEEKPLFFSILTDSDLLIIDDLGSEPIYNKITLEYLFIILEARKNKDKPFIITTNLSLKEILSRYGERVFSRIIQENTTEIFEFDCENLRNLK